MASLLLNGSISPKAAAIWSHVTGLLRQAVDEVLQLNADHHSCSVCGDEVWNDCSFPNHGHVTLSARELGMRSLPGVISRFDGKIVCVVCRNRFSAQYGDGNTV